MSNHTPGPWNATQFGEVMGPFGASKIARLYGPNMEGNARLIAAAPELLEVLKTMVDPAMKPKHLMREEWERLPWIVAARTAISKATGNPQAEDAR